MINQELIISSETTLMEAFQRMDDIERKLLVICDDGIFKGVISVGDIQRAILDKKSLDEKVIRFVRPDIIYASYPYDKVEISNLMQKERIESMPVVSSDNELVDVLDWSDFFTEEKLVDNKNIELPVVIMAGGKGQRLKPLTNIIPKPLVPVSDKTIIEEVMDEFVTVGCKEFFLSLNYKADEIEEFFNKKELSESISFIRESEYLGTAGALFFLKDIITSTFFVSNCDILVDVNFHDLLKYHKENGNTITMVSVIQNYQIPYGTIETSENGKLIGIHEKPSVTYQINSGLYILEPDVFDYMKEKRTINITDLINNISDDGKNVGVFPVSSGAWSDMGNWDSYLQLISHRNQSAIRKGL